MVAISSMRKHLHMTELQMFAYMSPDMTLRLARQPGDTNWFRRSTKHLNFIPSYYILAHDRACLVEACLWVRHLASTFDGANS